MSLLPELQAVGLLPREVNQGPWVTAYTLYQLRQLPVDTEFVLPICSLATPNHELTGLGTYLLPPLYQEGMDTVLQQRIVERIHQCFPRYGDVERNRQRLKVVELPRRMLKSNNAGGIVAFSVDTAVEEHGPHLPLGTDTIQSYSVLHALAARFDEFEVMRPLDYGQLTWGLPFGFSVDLTAELLAAYVTGCVNAIQQWRRPKAIYVVDVHGSIVHRRAIVEGLVNSKASAWSFRWLHEPLAEFASARGDQHAGGVETSLVHRVDRRLIDGSWWPQRESELVAGQMAFSKAVELTPDLKAFQSFVDANNCNGIIGDVANFHRVDSELMFARMIEQAASDVQQLINQEPVSNRDAGKNLW